MKLRSVAARVALAAMLVAALVVAVMAGGVLLVGMSSFDRLMAEHGATAAESRAMFDQAITPVVLAASPPVGIDADCVLVDDFGGTREACRRLLARGHRRISFLGLPAATKRR